MTLMRRSYSLISFRETQELWFLGVDWLVWQLSQTREAYPSMNEKSCRLNCLDFQLTSVRVG